MITIVSRPDWTSVATAIGTVAVAVVAVGVALYAQWRSDKRLRAEHERSDRMLAEERALSAASLREERQLFQDRDQFAEAYAVQVVLARRAGQSKEANRLVAKVDNHGNQTITRVEARFSPDGMNVITHRRQIRLPGHTNLPDQLKLEPPFEKAAEVATHGHWLTPWDTGMSIETDDIGVQRLRDPRVIVRWTDRWGTRWEHRRGVVQKITEGTVGSLTQSALRTADTESAVTSLACCTASPGNTKGTRWSSSCRVSAHRPAAVKPACRQGVVGRADDPARGAQVACGTLGQYGALVRRHPRTGPASGRSARSRLPARPGARRRDAVAPGQLTHPGTARTPPPHTRKSAAITPTLRRRP